MKKALVLIVALALTLSFAGCNKEEKVIDTAALEDEIMGANLFDDTLVRQDKDRISNAIGLDISYCEDAVFYAGGGQTGDEFGWFLCNSAKDAEAMEEQLLAHNAWMAGQYADYAADKVPVLNNYILKREGRYVVYVTAQDHNAAADIVNKYF